MKLRWPGDASDGEVRLMLAQPDSDFRGEARSARPRRRSSSSMGCEPGGWRILAGEDAKMIDAAVRAHPEAADDYAELFSAAAEQSTAQTPER